MESLVVQSETCMSSGNDKSREKRDKQIERARKIRELNPNIHFEWHEVYLPDELDDGDTSIDSCETFVELVTKFGNRENMDRHNEQ